MRETQGPTAHLAVADVLLAAVVVQQEEAGGDGAGDLHLAHLDGAHAAAHLRRSAETAGGVVDKLQRMQQLLRVRHALVPFVVRCAATNCPGIASAAIPAVHTYWWFPVLLFRPAAPAAAALPALCQPRRQPRRCPTSQTVRTLRSASGCPFLISSSTM